MWQEAHGKLIREYVFQNFYEAFGFLAQVGLFAEKYDHHPTIINTYNKVRLELTTHSEWNIVTKKDHILADAIDTISLI